MDFYNIHTLSELAVELKTTQPTISSWKKRNSINAIKKKCRELQIFDEVFDENELLDELDVKKDFLIISNSIELRLIKKKKDSFNEFQQEFSLLNKCFRDENTEKIKDLDSFPTIPQDSAYYGHPKQKDLLSFKQQGYKVI